MLAENIHKRRRVVLALSCVVVFVTTYMLILPAFTLEKTKAAEQGGIDVPGVTTTEEVTEEEADANDGQTDAQDVQSESGKTEDGKAEDSGSQSKDSDEAKANTSAEDPLTFKEEHYTIAVDDKNSVLPENTEIKVEEIDKNEDAKKYQKHFDDALAAIQEEKDGENVSDLEFARFYDISLVSDGKEVTLGNGDKVSVNIEYDKELRKALGVENKDNIRIIHFAENKDTGKVEAEVLDNKEAKVTAETTEDNLLKEAAFDADSFSVYGLVYVKEAEEEAAEEKAEDVEDKEEKKEDIEGVSELDLGTAVVSATDGQDLPEDAGGHAGVVDGEKAIAAVEKKVDDLDGNVEYKVFDIALENVDESAYEGFKVDVNLPEELKGRDFRLFHYHGGKVEELSLETSGTTDNNNVDTVDGFTFETEGFSQFVLSYTVDFEYEGLTFKLDGGNKMYLSELFSELGIKESVEDVKDVVFSDPTLVEVTHKTPALGFIGKEDWVLKSLKAFTSEETLTIVFDNGNTIKINVTDAQYTTDLNSLMTGIQVKVNGQTLKDGDTITVDSGDQFDLHLELSENDFYQFVDDGTPMTFKLPDGVNLGENLTRYITINLGIDGKVYRNPLVYDSATNTLTLTWNTKDPNFSKLTAADNAKVSIDLNGYFNEDASHIKWSENLEIDVEHEERHSADINKTGQFFAAGADGNPYDVPAIQYTVTINSSGNNTVNVKDTVEGKAITLDTSSFHATSNKDTAVNVNPNTKGFEINGRDMVDGEKITVTYWGKVDTSQIENITSATFSETGNKVKLTGTDIPEKEVTHYQREIGHKNVYKASTGVTKVSETEDKVSWKIVVNENPTESIGNSTITDSIAENSKNVMSYDTSEKPHLIVRDKNGNIVESRSGDLNWSDLGITNPATDKSWTYHIPANDGIYSYEITYKTTVDTSNMTSPSTVSNNVETKNGDTTGTANVGPKPENQKYVISKSKVSSSEEKSTWSITVTADPGNYDKFVVTDTLPTKDYYGRFFVDGYEIDSARIIGLEGDEWVDIVTHQDYIDKHEAIAAGDNEQINRVEFVFYKDGKATSDKSHPGLSATGQRTFTIELTSNNSKQWIEAAKAGDEGALKHENAANINGVESNKPYTEPMAKTVFKYRGDSKRNVDGPSGYTDVQFTDGTAYPMYTFRVVVGGVDTDSVTIEDYFDTDLFKIYNPNDHNKAPQFWGGNGDPKYAHNEEIENYADLTWQEENGKVTFTANNIPKDDKAYYSFYMVEYNLIPKNQEAWDTLKQMALENGGEVILKNKAKYDESESDLDFKYNYNVIDKSSSSETDTDTGIALEKYTIKINPDCLKLNEGDTMTMTDTYSQNLSVDFGSIKVTAKDKQGNDRSDEVTWDYRGHVGTFTIPDETYVIITYTARVVGDEGTLQTVSNTAYMEGYFDTVTSERVVGGSGEGSATNYRIRLFKFAAGHMEKGLNGAKFRLLDQDKNPIVDKNGNPIVYETKTVYLNKLGVVNTGDDYLPVHDDGTPTVNEWTDVTAEARERESSKPASERLYKYSDLTEVGMSNNSVTLYSGYAEVSLNQKEQGVAIKKERVYYLEEIQPPVGENGEQYEQSFVQYSFLITDQADYTAPGGIYVYHNNDVMTVRNWETDKTSLKISKKFTGNADLTEEQKNAVTFKLQVLNPNTNEYVDKPIDVWNPATGAVEQKATFTYGDKKNATDPLFVDGVLTVENIEAGTYRVIESNQNIDDFTRKTEYIVDGNEQTVANEELGVNVTVTPEDVAQNKSHYVAITNSYFSNEYDIIKVASDTAQVLGNAKFEVRTASDNTKVKDITTSSDGNATIKYSDGGYSYNTLYYFVETEAPEGYITPDNPDKYYFYFSEYIDNPWTPTGLPEGETAVDLTTGFGSATISNRRDVDKTYIEVNKKWVDNVGKDITNTMTDEEGVEVELYRTTKAPTSGTVITGGDTENAVDASELKTLTANGNSYSFLPGDRFQVTVRGTDVSSAQVDGLVDAKLVQNTANTRSWIGSTANYTNNISVNNAGEGAAITVVNLTAKSRVFRLKQSDLSGISGGQKIDQVTLDTSNDWAKTFANLPISDDNGMPYFYYIVEKGPYATNTTEYSVAEKAITVTNHAPKQLEVNKVWKNADGENINNTKTDGEITYDLYQVENVPAVSPDYSHTGNIGVVSVLKRETYNSPEPVNITGDVDGKIKAGSKVQIVIKTTDQHNSPLVGDITVSGGAITSDITQDNGTYDQWNNFSFTDRTRTITISSDVEDTIRVQGTFNAKGDSNVSVVLSVIEEPTDAATDFDSLTKNVGTVTVTYDNATLAKEAAFDGTNIRVTPGTKHWSSLVSNLPATGRNNNGLNVNYTYYVEEKSATGFDFSKAEYTNNNVASGETIVITNQEEDLPGSLIVKKAFDGFDYDSLTDAQKAALSGISFVVTGPNDYEETVQLTDALGNGKKLENLKAGDYYVEEQRADATTPSGYIYKETTVKVDAGAPAQTVTATVAVSANGEATVTYTNKYEPESIDLDIVKVDRADNQPLGGAVFTLKKFSDTAPTEGGTLDYVTDSDRASDPTNATTGKTAFTGLDSGYYEVTETTRPEGYVLTGETTFYFKVFNGTVTYITKGSGKPSSWAVASATDYISYTAASANSNAKFTVGNDFGTELPHTGGIGTTIFYILGSILVIGGGIYFISRRRAMK